jgi:hypothetical protein
VLPGDLRIRSKIYFFRIVVLRSSLILVLPFRKSDLQVGQQVSKEEAFRP